MDGKEAILAKIRSEIVRKSPFDDTETQRILLKYFSKVPANVRILLDNYNFDQLKVLEIGSSYGEALLYWGPESEGIEIQPHMVEFTRVLGRNTHMLNVEDGFFHLIKPESYDAVHTNNLIEHLISPHLFLLRLYRVLRNDGILAIGHPVVPPPLLQSFWKAFGFKGWQAVEHVNFFIPETIKLTLERAGFRIICQYFPGLYQIHPLLSKVFVPVGVQCLTVCRKTVDFKYPLKRSADFDPQYAASDLRYFH